MATGPSVASAGPSIAGAVFHVIVVSLQLQFEMAWMVPPVTLLAFVALDTCSVRCAPVTSWAPEAAAVEYGGVGCGRVGCGAEAEGVGTIGVRIAPQSSVST